MSTMEQEEKKKKKKAYTNCEQELQLLMGSGSSLEEVGMIALSSNLINVSNVWSRTWEAGSEAAAPCSLLWRPGIQPHSQVDTQRVKAN